MVTFAGSFDFGFVCCLVFNCSVRVLFCGFTRWCYALVLCFCGLFCGVEFRDSGLCSITYGFGYFGFGYFCFLCFGWCSSCLCCDVVTFVALVSVDLCGDSGCLLVFLVLPVGVHV